jgi:outer membrane protein TolC
MTKSFVRRVTAGLALAALIAAPAAAQTRLTLADAIRRATDHSEALAIARAGESRADADLQRARSARMPQVSFAGTYERTLASEFSALVSSGPVCAPLSVDATRPLADRLTELERAAGCGSIGSSFNFGDLPFGQRNVYRASLSFAQALYSGGRITAQQTQADLSSCCARRWRATTSGR